MAKYKLSSNGVVNVKKNKDIQVIPNYDDDKNSVRAETQDLTLKKNPYLIPHLEDPESVKKRLKKRNIQLI